MSIFELRKDLQNHLHRDLRAIMQQTNSPLIFGHICCGILDSPGALRISDITMPRPSSSLIESFCRNEEDDVKRDAKHKLVFRQHIRRFGRYSTLLDWIALWIYQNGHNGIDEAPLEPHVVTFMTGANQPLEFSDKDSNIEISLSDKLVSALVPLDIIKAYLQNLYDSVGIGNRREQESTLNNSYFESRLIGARAHAYELLKDHEKSLGNLNLLAKYYRHKGIPQFSEQNVSDDALAWLFVTALQTGFMYVSLASQGKKIPPGLISGGMVFCANSQQHIRNRETSIQAMPLLIVSPVLNADSDPSVVGNEILESLKKGSCRGTIHKIEGYSALPDPGGFSLFKTENWDAEVIKKLLQERIAQCFAAHALPKWPLSATIWLSLILEWLRGSIHEGAPLSFCFVLADRTQLQDSAYFDLVKLPNCDLASPVKDNGSVDSDFRSFSDTIRQQIVKNNYAWFHEGRYALLWDATFPEKYPCWLVRLRLSSWNVFVTACRHGELAPASKEAVVVAYLRTDGSGGIILEGKNVLSFRGRDKWRGDGGKREEWLSNYLQQASSSMLGPSDRDKLLKCLMAISEDPHMGCMLVVFGESQREPIFHLMGNLWRIGAEPLSTLRQGGSGIPLEKIEESELISLMAMDGATCVWKDQQGVIRVDFRYLVKVPDSTKKLLSTVDSTNYLSGEGSRKWSGAMAATRDEVSLVIAVSQDGPTYVFASEDMVQAVEPAIAEIDPKKELTTGTIVRVRREDSINGKE